MTWVGCSPKTGKPVDAPMEQLVTEGHLDREHILEMIQHCDMITQCIVCGKQWGKLWLMNPQESDVDHVCPECIKKYDHN